MILKISENNINDAALVYMDSWKESHKDICSLEFIEKHDFDYMHKYLSEKIENGYDLYINYFNNVPVGIIGINPADEEICLLYVAVNYQHMGFGDELLSFALAKCKNPYITVLDTNKKAINFYSKRGFVPLNQQPEMTPKKQIFERKYVYQNKNM